MVQDTIVAKTMSDEYNKLSWLSYISTYSMLFGNEIKNSSLKQIETHKHTYQ